VAGTEGGGVANGKIRLKNGKKGGQLSRS